MLYELVQAALIFKALEVAQICTVIQRRQLHWKTLVVALLTVGHFTSPDTPAVARSASPVQYDCDDDCENDDTDEALEEAHGHIRKLSDELPSITEEDFEDEDLFDENDSLGKTPAKVLHYCTRQVTFTPTAKIYHFAMVAGDNPSVSSGPPVQLDWSPFEQSVHKQQVPLRDTSGQFRPAVRRISADDRIRILQENGTCSKELKVMDRKAKAASKSRQATLSTLNKQRKHEKRESFFSFMGACQSSRGLDLDLYEPFLSTPQDLQSGGRKVCVACSRRCLLDTETTTLAMYFCPGGDMCGKPYTAHRPQYSRNSIRKLRHYSETSRKVQVSACTA